MPDAVIVCSHLPLRLFICCTDNQVKHDTTPIGALEDLLKEDQLYYDDTFEPISVHSMRRAMGVKPLWCLEYHICDGCHGHAYKPMHPGSYALPLSPVDAAMHPGYDADLYRCPNCEKARFHYVYPKNRSKHLQPHLVRFFVYMPPLFMSLEKCQCCDVFYALQKCWYFGVEDALVHPCHSDPDFIAAIGHDRTTDQPNTFAGSPEFRRLDESVGGALSQPAPPGSCVPHHCSHVSIGFDFGQVFKNKDRSTGVMCIRFVVCNHFWLLLSYESMHSMLTDSKWHLG